MLYSLSRGDCGNSHGGFHGGHSGHGFYGGSRGGGRGNRKCDHCGGLNHTEPYCWVKYGKPDYVN